MKRDLNLIPRTRTESSLNKYILPVLLIIVLYASTAYLAITIPQNRLLDKENEYSAIQAKVLELEHVEVEYQQLRAQLAEVEAKKKTVEQTKHSDTDPINVLNLIEQACPKDVILNEINASSNGVVLYGMAASDSLIAEFTVNLRAIELFYDTNITSITQKDVDFSISQLATTSGIDLPDIRQFQLTLAFMPQIATEDGELEGGQN